MWLRRLHVARGARCGTDRSYRAQVERRRELDVALDIVTTGPRCGPEAKHNLKNPLWVLPLVLLNKPDPIGGINHGDGWIFDLAPSRREVDELAKNR
jgi:hypothetical protein